MMLYGRPDDNIAPDATWTASAEDPDYLATYLADLDVSNPAKLTTTSGGWVGDFGAPVIVEAIGLLNHNLDAGLDVVVQANITNDWGDPPLELAFTIPADDAGGFSINPWLDLRQPEGSEYEYQYWRIWVDEANSSPVAIGEVVMLATAREFWIDPAPGLQRSVEIPDIIHESGFGGQTGYTIGAQWYVWDGAIPGTEIDDHWSLALQARGRTRPFFFVPDQAVNSCYLVRFGWDGPRFTVVERGGQFFEVPAFRLREVSRGVPL